MVTGAGAPVLRRDGGELALQPREGGDAELDLAALVAAGEARWTLVPTAEGPAAAAVVAGADDALWRIRLRGGAVEVAPLPPHAEADHPRVEDGALIVTGAGAPGDVLVARLRDGGEEVRVAGAAERRPLPRPPAARGAAARAGSGTCGSATSASARTATACRASARC